MHGECSPLTGLGGYAADARAAVVGTARYRPSRLKKSRQTAPAGGNRSVMRLMLCETVATRPIAQGRAAG